MTPKKLRIAQVTNLQESVPPLNENGLEQIVHLLTEQLVKLGHEVTLFATADSKTSAKLFPLWPKAVSRSDPTIPFSTDTYSQWSVSEAFLHHEDFDIIHDHTKYVSGHFAGLIDTPIVTTVHNPVSVENETLDNLPKEYQPYLERIIQRNQKFAHPVMVSQFQASTYRYPSTVIPNGIDIENFPFVKTHGNYLLYLGYITPNKGAAQAIEAVLLTKEKLIIAGPIRKDDPESQGYFDQKIKPHLGDQIQYVGPANKADKIKLLGDAKATLMPIQWDEPFGLVAIESLACGTPVIATNRAAMPEIIDQGKNGFLANSVPEISQYIQDVNKIDRMSCRKKVAENFTADIMTQGYLNLYTKLLS